MRRRVKEQLKKLGGMEFYDVNFSYIDNETFEEHYVSVPEQKTKMVRDTVPSLRLDGIVSSGFSISRGKAADYISAGKCELNYTPCVKGDKQTTEGDVITVRGLGKIPSAAIRKRDASALRLQDFCKEHAL
jgi:RNA-binding protein YlmH